MALIGRRMYTYGDACKSETMVYWQVIERRTFIGFICKASKDRVNGTNSEAHARSEHYYLTVLPRELPNNSEEHHYLNIICQEDIPEVQS
jgi:hypothetical protein